MIRLSFFTILFALTTAPAFAHEGAGIVHFLTQADHVSRLIAIIAASALPVLFWMVMRGDRPAEQKQKVRRD
jgi:hydrogenase/urease accessory protein HupE